MGNRAYIVVKTSDNPADTVSLYGHWAGDNNLTAVRSVLARTDRLGDIVHLTGQLFYEFAVVLGGFDGELGYGIEVGENIYDGDNPAVVVDADTGEYWYDGERYTEYARLSETKEMN